MKEPKRWGAAMLAGRQDADGGADWFDPNYYDGIEPERTFTSSHFLYEAVVENTYKHDRAGWNERIDGDLRGDLVRHFWKNGGRASAFAEDIAAVERRSLAHVHSRVEYASFSRPVRGAAATPRPG